MDVPLSQSSTKRKPYNDRSKWCLLKYDQHLFKPSCTSTLQDMRHTPQWETASLHVKHLLSLIGSHPSQRTESHYSINARTFYKNIFQDPQAHFAKSSINNSITKNPLFITFFILMKVKTDSIILFANSKCYHNPSIETVHKRYFLLLSWRVLIHTLPSLMTCKRMILIDSK